MEVVALGCSNAVLFPLSHDEASASRCIKDGLESLQASSADQVENAVAVVQPACDKDRYTCLDCVCASVVSVFLTVCSCHIW